ncbi:hypothetical protein GCM10009825_26260 [Arthrobacter humicola]|uniref:Uncharacterized protein n=1 Tax=Arthrobacter humicola TaxID=409291 RepID=A0ABN2ZAL9_9MICC
MEQDLGEICCKHPAHRRLRWNRLSSLAPVEARSTVVAADGRTAGVTCEFADNPPSFGCGGVPTQESVGMGAGLNGKGTDGPLRENGKTRRRPSVPRRHPHACCITRTLNEVMTTLGSEVVR